MDATQILGEPHKAAFRTGDKVVITGFKIGNPAWPGDHFFGSNTIIEQWVCTQRVVTVSDPSAEKWAGNAWHRAVKIQGPEGSTFWFLPAELRRATEDEIAAEVAHD